MLTFILDIAAGYLIGSQAWSLQRTLLACLAAGQVVAVALALVSLVFGGRPFSSAEALINLVLSGVIHAVVAAICAYFARRRAIRGYGA